MTVRKDIPEVRFSSVPPDLGPLVPTIEKVTGQRVSLSTTMRWAIEGRRGVKLRTWMFGGRRMTNEASVIEFVSQLTEESTVTDPAPLRSAKQRERDISNAERKLANLRAK